jgi:hypothetical protein
MSIVDNKPLLIIIGYNRLQDGYKSCANYLEQQFEVRFFPLMWFKTYSQNPVPYLISLLDSKTPPELPCPQTSLELDIIDHYRNTCQLPYKPCSILLLWYFNYFSQTLNRLDQFQQLKNHILDETKIIGYSWDPMIIKSELSVFHTQLISELDAYFTGDAQELRHLMFAINTHTHIDNILIDNNNATKNLKNIKKNKNKFIKIKKIKIFFDFESIKNKNKIKTTNLDTGISPQLRYVQSGFDPSITQKNQSENYQCDVSFVGTNLYDNEREFPPDQMRIPRRVVLDAIYAEHLRGGLIFHVYGPDWLKNIYPQSYQRSLPYTECGQIFSTSRINLCLHAISYNSLVGQEYFSDRLPQILGVGGLLVTETNYPTPNSDGAGDGAGVGSVCIQLDANDPLRTIRDLLNDYESPRIQNMKRTGYDYAHTNLTWAHLLKHIVDIQ